MGYEAGSGIDASNVLKGYEEFFGVAVRGGGTWNYKKIVSGALYDTYKSELNTNCPIHFHLRTTRDTEASNYQGHAVMLFGYADDTSGRNHYYFVMDGWRNYGRFVRHGYFPWIFGEKIWVK